MRPLASLVSLALVACAADPATDSAAPPASAPPTTTSPPPATVHEVTVPAQTTTSHDGDTLFGSVVDQRLLVSNELTYALGDDYPRKVTVAAPRVCLGKACTPVYWPRWTAITHQEGDAAKVDLDVATGRLTLELLAEGTVTLLVEGTVTGEAATTSRLELVLHVTRVAGFVIEQRDQLTYACPDTLVLPADAPWDAPTVSCLDAADEPFYAANAPVPAAVTVRSEGTLALAGAGQLAAAAGRVTLAIDTALPVRGLRSFEVVGPETVTSAQTSFYLNRAIETMGSSGSQWAPIVEGTSYPIPVPGRRNTVAMMPGVATTTRGPLCAPIPIRWFASSTSTPEQCAARGSLGALDGEDTFTIGTVLAPGECQLAVTIPGTSQRWTTRFTAAW